jgi:hypothetical protein
VVNGETAEAALRRACDAILAGDYMSAMTDLTQEAMNDAMALGATLTTVPVPQSYAVESHETPGTDERFVVRFATTMGDFRATVTYRQIEGAWKIVALAVETLPSGTT